MKRRLPVLAYPPTNRSLSIFQVSGLALLACLLSPTWGFAQYAPTEPVDPTVKTGFDTITEDDSKHILSILTGQGFDGRGTGQDGYIRAAHFVAGRLAEYGFKPIGDGGTYFQNLPFRQVLADTAASSIKVGDTVFTGEGSIGFSQVSGSQPVSGNVVVVKAKGPTLRFEEREAVDGKVVLLITEDADPRFDTTVQRGNPAAILRIADGAAKNQPTQIRPGGSIRSQGIRAEIGKDHLDSLAKALGVDAKVLALPTEEKIEIVPLDASLAIDLKAIERGITVPNVVGWLEGSDPEVNDEYIVIGAHLDHLGIQGGQLFPGADDNGSGSTAILQIARALHANPTKPRRSILYMAFAAEEMGLVGSKHYVENPIMPLDKAVCMLNIDMIGRNEEKADEPASENEDSIHLVGTKQLSDELHQAVLEANKHVGFRFEYDEEQVYRRSDHYSFASKSIPSTFLFGGFNPYYHQTTDGLEGINYSKIANAARLYYLVAMAASETGKYKLNEEAKP
jgi:hypothetical protein